VELIEDEIISVDTSDIRQTFDISVAGNHNFMLANDILSHNSGKTTGMISTAKYITRFTNVPFIPHYVCSNEQYYIQRVKNAVDDQSLVIDEQLETHVGSAKVCCFRRNKLGLIETS
jgi:hypothetical protein